MEKYIIFENLTQASQQVDELVLNYPCLKIIMQDANQIVIAGTIQISRIFDDFPVIKKVQVEITIPINQAKFPEIKDIGGDIEKNYKHLYASGKLCLATDLDLIMHFIEGFNLTKWVQDFVEPYYFSYEYYCRFGVFPFEDRAHGCIGIMQSYCDLFALPPEDTLKVLLNIESTASYRGHWNCFCGKNKKMRICHGKKILLFYNHQHLRNQLLTDLNKTRKEVSKYATKNSEVTK